MAATLGHGRRDIIEAARAQAETLAYVHNERLDEPGPGTTRARADRGRARGVRPRALHGQRGRRQRDGDPARPQLSRRARRARAMAGDLAGSGVPRSDDGDARAHRSTRAASPVRPLPADTCISRRARGASTRPAKRRSRLLDQALEQAGPGTSPRSSASRSAPPHFPPTPRPPFWEGLAERRERHGFLVCFDEVVTGVGRTGAGSPARRPRACPTSSRPRRDSARVRGDRGRARPRARLRRRRPRLATLHTRAHLGRGPARMRRRSRRHGGPAVGAADRAGPGPRTQLCGRTRAPSPASRSSARCGATATCSEWSTSIRATDDSFLPPELRVAGRIDAVAFEHGLITLSTQPTRDGYAGDQTLFAPAFIATDDELAEMVSRFADAVRRVAEDVEPELRRSALDRRRSAMNPPEDGSRPHAGPHPPARGAHAPGPRDRVARRRTARASRRSGSTSTTARSTPPVRPHRLAGFGVRRVRRHEAVRAARGAPAAASRRRGRAGARSLLRRPDARAGARRRGVPRRPSRRSAGSRCGARIRSWCPRDRGSSGTSTRSRFRRSDLDRRDRRRPAGLRRRSEPRAAVPSRGDDRDHGRLGARIPPRARRRRRRSRTPCSRRRSDGQRRAADVAAAPGPLPRDVARLTEDAANGRPADGTTRRRWGWRRSARDETRRLPPLPRPRRTRTSSGATGSGSTTTDGRRILDACSGGAMVACLGHGVPESSRPPPSRPSGISYFYNHHFTNEPQERLADRLLEVAAPEMARVRFVSGGSEANETALQLARLYHVERGEHERWRVDLAGAGLPRLDDGNARPERPARAAGALHALPRPHLHLAPRRGDRPDRRGRARGAGPPPRGGRAGDDRRLLLRARERGRAPGLLAAGALLERPRRAADGARLPDLFRRGGHRDGTRGDLAGRPPAADRARHRRHGEGPRRGVRAARRGALPAARVRRHRSGSREFDLGHTWDGAPLSSAVGLSRPRSPGRARLGGPGPRTRTRACATSSKRRSRDSRSSERCAAAGSCSASSSSTRATASRSSRSSSTPRRSSTTPRSSASSSSRRPIRRPTASPATRRSSLPRT